MSDPSSFVYEDADNYQNEISEIYSYCEESEFFANRNAFEEFMEDCGLPLTWEHMVKEQKWTAINHIMSTLDLSCRTTRIKSCRAISYLIQGNFGGCSTLEQQMDTCQQNVFLLYEQNIFQIFVQQLLIEVDHPTPSSELQRQGANAPLTQIYVDSTELRVILSVLCTITETMYHSKDNPDPRIQDLRQQFIMELQTPFGDELFAVTLFQLLNKFCKGFAPHFPVKKLAILLWKVLLLTLGGSSTLRQLKENYRKLAGIAPLSDETLEMAKNMRPCSPPLLPNGQPRTKPTLGREGPFGGKRKVFKQTAFDDAVFSYALKSFSDQPPQGNLESQQNDDDGKFSFTPNDSMEANSANKNNKVDESDTNDNKEEHDGEKIGDAEMDTTMTGQTTNESSSNSSDSSDSEINNQNDGNDIASGNEDDIASANLDEDKTENANENEVEIDNDNFNDNEIDEEKDDQAKDDALNNMVDYFGSNSDKSINLDITFSETLHHPYHNPAMDMPLNSLRTPSPQPKSLPWSPKVRKTDLSNHLCGIRQKFFGYTLHNDVDTLFGLPDPIIEGVNVMKKHLYTSLADAQLIREELIMKYPVTHKDIIVDYKNAPAERLYCELLPKMPQYIIALLKILLAASTPTKSRNERTESINIMSEIDPDNDDCSSHQGMTANANAIRHKEIIIKSISSILILLLKHFKINHIYQFEYVSQQMMFANCIPLVLKFLSQDVYNFVSDSRSEIAMLDFPGCVIGESPALASVLSQLWTKEIYSRRNMFSCINMVRILNKLVKWKHSRVMMLVVFKSAPTLIKALNIRNPVFQLYVLKLLKIQLKFMGRPWKKNNMKLISAIYQKVRHRLTDDWAYSNDNEAKPWDFQSEEFTLQSNIHRFHQRRYQRLLTQDNKSATTSVFQQTDRFDADFYDQDDFPEENSSKFDVEFTSNFEANYERWLENEVFRRDTDWSSLLDSDRTFNSNCNK